MSTVSRGAMLAVIALFGLLALPPAQAGTTTEKSRQLGIEVARQWKAADSLYREEKLQAAFAHMERLEAALNAHERLRLEQRPKSPTEEELRLHFEALAFEHYKPRKFLATMYLAHGCHHRAAANVERQLSHIRKVPDFEANPAYGRFLALRVRVAEDLGQLDKAVEYMELILDHVRRQPAKQRQIPGTLLLLARLHRQSGDPNKAQDLVAEARAIYDDAWRRQPPSDQYRRAVEVRLLLAEGRRDETKAKLVDIISVEQRQATPRKGVIALAFLSLAALHRELDQDQEHISALENALRNWIDATPVDFARERAVTTAYRLATALRKAGKTETANELIEKYRLCID